MHRLCRVLELLLFAVGYIRPLHPISSYDRSGHETPVQVFCAAWIQVPTSEKTLASLIRNGSCVLVSSLSGIRLVLTNFEVTKKEGRKEIVPGTSRLLHYIRSCLINISYTK